MEILIIFFALLIALLVLGMPVAYAIGITSVVALTIKWGYGALSFGLIAQMLVYGVNNFPILAVPLFLLAGAIMNASGITDRIFSFALAVVGHIRGGLAQVNVLASFIFSGMSGAAAADVAGLGQVEVRAMVKAGYPRAFACAVTGASATIGPIVPPSVPLVLYAIIANTSVTKLFIAGIVPGVLMALALMAFCAVIAKRRGFPTGDSFSLIVLNRSFRRAFLPLLTPVIIIGGIWSGIFTPTEAAAVACIYATVLAFAYRTMSRGALLQILRETALNSAAILMILAAAMIYNSALTRTQVPQQVTEVLFAFSNDPLVVLILLNLVLFVAGMFMSTAETILLLTPLIAPLLPKFGIDTVHFGIIMVLNLMIGQLTPPFGIVLYILQRVGDIAYDQLVRALLPFYGPIGIVLILTILYAPIATWLPSVTIR
ncbi:MAG: TRAP transporter large permease [Alphaproteobacteria bacterium]|nr:TRAP transporter large permease [Alphaproteobacteria bacterium]